MWHQIKVYLAWPFYLLLKRHLWKINGECRNQQVLLSLNLAYQRKQIHFCHTSNSIVRFFDVRTFLFETNTSKTTGRQSTFVNFKWCASQPDIYFLIRKFWKLKDCIEHWWRGLKHNLPFQHKQLCNIHLPVIASEYIYIYIYIWIRSVRCV